MTNQIAEVPVEDRIPVGTVVRCTRDNPEFDAVEGREYLIESYVPADQGDAEPPQPYYELADLPGQSWSTGIYAAVDDLEVVRSAAEQTKRMRYTIDEVLDLIQDGLMSAHGDDFYVFESDRLTTEPQPDTLQAQFEGEHGFEKGVEFYARRPGGASFGCVIRITALWPTDD